MQSIGQSKPFTWLALVLRAERSVIPSPNGRRLAPIATPSRAQVSEATFLILEMRPQRKGLTPAEPEWKAKGASEPFTSEPSTPTSVYCSEAIGPTVRGPKTSAYRIGSRGATKCVCTVRGSNPRPTGCKPVAFNALYEMP
jgi:hypothetical protein